jgi:hypothetical protein
MAFGNLGRLTGAMAKPPKKRKPVVPAAKKPATAPATPAAKPYDIFAPRYPTQGALDETARTNAQTQVQPVLNEVGLQRQREGGMHAGREQDLSDWYGWAADQAKQNLAALSTGMQGVVSAAGAAGQNASDLLGAAMRGGQEREQDFGKMVGAGSYGGGKDENGFPEAQAFDPQLLAATAADNAAGRNNLTNLSLATLGAEGARGGLLGTGLIQAQQAEDRRHRGVGDDLQTQERQATGQLPGLISTETQKLGDDEFQRQLAVKQYGEQKANRLFQQYMSEKEFGLKSKSLDFQQWLSKQQLSLDTRSESETERSHKVTEGQQATSIGIDQQRADQEGARIQADIDNATDPNTKEQLKLKAQRHNAGVAALSSYLAPAKSETNKSGVLTHTKKGGPTNYSKRVSYEQALRILKGQVGIGPVEARQIIAATVSMPDWRKRAEREANEIKRYRKQTPKQRKASEKKVVTQTVDTVSGLVG